MSDLVPQINSLSPAPPIVIVIDPATGLGKSAGLQLNYTVTNSTWQAGDPNVDFKALLQATNQPYRVIGGTPTIEKNQTLTKRSDDFVFDFQLETIAAFVGGVFPVTLRLCVYDIADGPGFQKCDEKHFDVTLK
jgi:hypothetical protein